MVLICDHDHQICGATKGQRKLVLVHHACVSILTKSWYMHYEIHNLYCPPCKARKVITIILIMLLCMPTYTKCCENYKQVEWHMFMLSQDICCR